VKIRRAVARKARVEMLPLIDIVFLLLVFFIYAMLSMAVHRGLPVELPVSASAAPEQELVLGVTVRRVAGGETEVYLDEELVVVNELAERLRARAAGGRQGAEPGVLLFADRQVDYQQLFRVLDQINRAGLSRISLQADVER
jgi:biopolymer transport protein ExbD